jgi:hypothetical protein
MNRYQALRITPDVEAAVRYGWRAQVEDKMRYSPTKPHNPGRAAEPNETNKNAAAKAGTRFAIPPKSPI